MSQAGRSLNGGIGETFITVKFIQHLNNGDDSFYVDSSGNLIALSVNSKDAINGKTFSNYDATFVVDESGNVNATNVFLPSSIFPDVLSSLMDLLDRIVDVENNYVSISYLTSTLANYVTNSSLTTTLASYVTNSSLTTTLSDYVTNDDLTTALAPYVTNDELTTALAPYVTETSLNTTLAPLFAHGVKAHGLLRWNTDTDTYVLQNGWNIYLVANPAVGRGIVTFASNVTSVSQGIMLATVDYTPVTGCTVQYQRLANDPFGRLKYQFDCYRSGVPYPGSFSFMLI